MAVGAGLVLAASIAESLPLFIAGFIALFVLSGLGNGSTYKMIPAIFQRQGRPPASPRAPTWRPRPATPAGCRGR